MRARGKTWKWDWVQVLVFTEPKGSLKEITQRAQGTLTISDNQLVWECSKRGGTTFICGEGWYVWKMGQWELWSRNSGGDLLIPTESWRPPSDFIQRFLNNALPTSPHLLPTQVHPQPLRCPNTQAAFLFCLSLSITYPHSTPVHILTPICCHVSTSICTYTPHWKKKKKNLFLSLFFLIFSSVSSSLTFTYSPQAWET